MTEITKYYDPMRGAEDLRRRIDTLFTTGSFRDDLLMNIDVSENSEEVCVVADLPGVQKKDITLRVNSGHMELSATREEEKREKRSGYHRSERSFGSVTRIIPLPDVDREKISAELEDGVLEVHLPKTEKQEAEITITEKNISGQ